MDHSKGRLLKTVLVMLITVALLAPIASASPAISFGACNTVGTRGDYINSVAVGDFDGDGDLDVVSGDEDNQVVAWENDGTPFSGGWYSQTVGTRGDLIRSVAVGDFDDDGKPDIVSGDEDNQVVVWKNDGTPFSSGWYSQTAGTRGASILSVAVGDFDGDRDPDIVSGAHNDEVVVWENDGTPFFGGWYSQTVGTRGQDVDSVAAGDLDCDGDLDVLSGDEDGDVVGWENDGTPFTDGWAATVVYSVNESPDDVRSVAVADLDGDWALDIVSGDMKYRVTACENLAECPTAPVGGIILPLDKSRLLLPSLGLAALVVLVGAAVVANRWRRLRINP